MYDKTVRRRRAVLGVLVALSLILLSASFGGSGGGGLHSLQRGVVAVVSPIQDGASRALKPIRDLFGWVGSTLNAKSQRNKLQAEVIALQREEGLLVSYKREYTQLAALTGIDQRDNLAQYQPITARVIGASPSLWYSTIELAAGSGGGVHLNDTVINGAGLIGKVTFVAPDASVVTLITDQSSGVSARDGQSQALGMVQPAVGNPNDLLLQFVSDPNTVTKGDLIVTAGTISGDSTSTFPPNIPIGYVTSVTPNDIYANIHISPVANLRNLEFVQVLSGSGAAQHGAVALASVGGG